MKDLEHEPDSDFGGCPECGGDDGYLNVGRDHWMFCETHRTRWLFGSNLFSSWRHETEEEWEANRRKLAEFRVVEPRFHRLAIDEERNRKERQAEMQAMKKRIEARDAADLDIPY